MFKNKKSNLDEMQEQKLLHIEKNGCWFVFWALVVSMVVQMVVYQENVIEKIAGEWIVFMCLALYLMMACVKNGIWDRRLKADPKTNLICSLVAGVVTGFIFGIINYVQYGYFMAAVWVIIINFFFISIVCFIALTIITSIYKKRLNKMEKEYEE